MKKKMQINCFSQPIELEFIGIAYIRQKKRKRFYSNTNKSFFQSSDLFNFLEVNNHEILRFMIVAKVKKSLINESLN